VLSFSATATGGGAGSFLERHWQKRPLWIPGGVDVSRLPSIEPDEVAWLATLEDVESRLVFTERRGGKTTYRMDTGPFSSERLESLPPADWTLLVQDAEKHLPELRAYLDLVPFVPDWRIDDLMISVAAPGGSVGPHRDNYDVFLVQASGRRRWHWTTAPVADDPSASRQLSLLQRFDPEDTHSAAPGDVLYLNPGVAHHGVAETLCVTCSVGMRAPRLSELSGRAVDHDVFYSDPDLGTEEMRPGHLSTAAVRRAAALLEQHGYGDVDAAVALGRFATLTKDWLQPDRPEQDEPPEEPLDVHGMARIAWTDTTVFANGRSSALPPGSAALVEALCASRHLGEAEQAPWREHEAIKVLLSWLWRTGIFNEPDDAADAAAHLTISGPDEAP
jgi:50S ribosomal protein L16 3-hydroxylase